MASASKGDPFFTVLNPTHEYFFCSSCEFRPSAVMRDLDTSSLLHLSRATELSCLDPSNDLTAREEHQMLMDLLSPKTSPNTMNTMGGFYNESSGDSPRLRQFPGVTEPPTVSKPAKAFKMGGSSGLAVFYRRPNKTLGKPVSNGPSRRQQWRPQRSQPKKMTKLDELIEISKATNNCFSRSRLLDMCIKSAKQQAAAYELALEEVIFYLISLFIDK